MTQWEFQTTCVKHCISPSIVWDNKNFRELVNNDNLTAETLNELLKHEFKHEQGTIQNNRGTR